MDGEIAVPKVRSHEVAVRVEFLIPKPQSLVATRQEHVAEKNSAEAEGAQNDQESGGGRNLKRPREPRPQQKDKLCPSVEKGAPCPKGSECLFQHDVIEFLANKPADLGPRCHQYDVFGYCPNGLACRFGDCHIDKAERINISRPESEGGVIKPIHLNVLARETSNLLRKKTYDYSTKKPKSKETVDTCANTAHAAENTPASDSTINQQECTSDESKGKEVEIFNSTPYPAKVKLVDFSNKVYVAPLTTVGNLPFRRILKEFGADITCGEMAMAHNLQQGQHSELALLRRHVAEDVFGVQIAGSQSDQMTRVAKMLENETETDFVDINCGCPIDLVCKYGAGSALLNKPNKLLDIVQSMAKHLSRPLTVKIRTGWNERDPSAHKLIPMLQKSAKGRIAAVMIHGRSRLQRYHKAANWEYILQAARSQDPNLPLLPIIGNGDILTWEDWKDHSNMLQENLDDSELLGLCSCAMIGRGALVKPWLPAELKSQQTLDISASERLDMLKKFCNYGFEHWGSDQQGINTTRRFLLEWLSFLHRYVPAGLLEHGHTQKMQHRPPFYHGRCDLETLLSSSSARDWIKISEMLLGPVPENFQFVPKHKSNSYEPDTDLVANG